ncbi:MAG: helix-turn-helix transcriptional regulator [Burkholderiales bacterium]
MKHSAEVAHFRQLCCLGIDSQTAMPNLLKALHRLIGSNSNSFYWATHNGDITNVYMEQLMPKDIAACFFKEFVNNRKREFSALDLRKYVPKGQVVGNSAKVFPKSFHNSDVYNLIWRPQARKHLLWARIRDAEGRANGVALSRIVGDAEFSERDEQLLTQLGPYLAHALNARPTAPAQFVDAGESAVVVVNRRGGIEHQSSEGRRLLLLAAHPRIAPGAVDWRGDSAVPAVLGNLLDRIEAVAAGRPTFPPIIELQSPWGKFVMRAYPMESSVATPNSLVVILIERHIPLKLKLLNAMQSLPLSAKQKEVCLLLTEGSSYQNLAVRLGVRPNTVVDHVRKIYDKLDVRSHHELLSTLAQKSRPVLPVRH